MVWIVKSVGGYDSRNRQIHATHSPPPRDAVRADPIGQQPADRAQHRARQRESRREGGRHHQRHAVLPLQILRNPQRQRGEAAEGDRVVLAQPPDPGIAQYLERFGPRAALLARARVARGGQPEQHRGDQQRHRVDARHGTPAVGLLQRRRDEQVHRRADRAGAEEAHREAALLGREEARHVRRAYRERRAHAAEEQPDQQELPQRGGVADREHRQRADRQQHRHHDAAAETVGPGPQRQAHQRAGQHRGRRQQAELRAVQAQLVAQRHADDAEHHPHHEADHEGQRAGDQHRPSLRGHPGAAADRRHVRRRAHVVLLMSFSLGGSDRWERRYCTSGPLASPSATPTMLACAARIAMYCWIALCRTRSPRK
ncbi:hypothetical protein OJJOAM_001419 [Cupriavidus sp. H18C1]